MDTEEAADIGRHLRAFCRRNPFAFQAVLSDVIDQTAVSLQLGPMILSKSKTSGLQPAEEKLKPFRSDDEEPLLEVVLHAQPVAEDAFILDGFEAI